MEMSSLESIVAGLELCKKIPDGEFTDTALVWIDGNTQNPEYVFVEPRRYAIDGTFIPAPTLEEILEGIGEIETWNTMKIARITDGKQNLTNNAMKRWLKLKGIESK